MIGPRSALYASPKNDPTEYRQYGDRNHHSNPVSLLVSLIWRVWNCLKSRDRIRNNKRRHCWCNGKDWRGRDWRRSGRCRRGRCRSGRCRRRSSAPIPYWGTIPRRLRS
jgi:hypothetical protein